MGATTSETHPQAALPALPPTRLTSAWKSPTSRSATWIAAGRGVCYKSEQNERLSSVAQKFPSLNFVTITVPDAESWDFVMEIAAALKNQGWNWIPCDGPLPKLFPQDGRPMSCWTILDHIQIDGAQNLSEVVYALEAAIRDPSIIGMDDVRPEINEAFPTTAIMVGAKR